MSTLVSLALLFGQLSLMGFGGGNTLIPEMQRQVVSVHHWMTAQEFSSLYGLAQAAPGPNMMIVVLVGWRVAGFLGAATAIVATFGPSSLLALATARVWQRAGDRPWRSTVQHGLLPITAGLVASSCVVIVHAAATTWVLGAIVLGSTLIFLRTRVHPLAILTAGALIGLVALGSA
jgi:chromate transporter